MDFKIGLEVHVALPTKTKLFCSCAANAQDPNSSICPICMGLPGSKPMLNSNALRIALSIASALKCDITRSISFVRKVYFYPDLPKSFQITQLQEPAGQNGLVVLDEGNVRIRRIQIEEDPAKIVRGDEYTLLDFNRSGVALVEIVTEPDITKHAQLKELLEELRSILYYLGVEIDKELKADLNVSVGNNGIRVETKNITGVRNIVDAAEYEISRQIKIIESGSDVKSETRSYDEHKMITESSRGKESDEEYGYIFEPDLTRYSTEGIEKIKPVIASALAKKYAEKYDINQNSVKSIIMFNKRALELIDAYEHSYNIKHLIKAIEISIRYNVIDMNNSSFAKLVEMISKDAYLDENTIKRIANNEMLDASITQTRSEVNQIIDIEIKSMMEKNINLIDEYSKNKKTFNFIVGQISNHLKISPKYVAERLNKMLEMRGKNAD